MTRKLQSTLQASGIQWPALRNHIPCMALTLQLTLAAFMRSLGVKGLTQSWEAHGHDQPFGEDGSIDIGNSQRHREAGNARINTVLAMRPALAKIIEKVRIWRYFENPETDSCRGANACCINYADTWSSKRVHWLSTTQSANSSTTCDQCEDMVQFITGVTWASLPITRIHPRVAQQSEIQSIPASLYN